MMPILRALTPRERRLRRQATADFRARVRRARLQSAGWSQEEYRTALRSAARLWSARLPWRIVPARVRLALFPHFGRRFTVHYLARWRAGSAPAPME